MANLKRVTEKIFAGNASASVVGQFGSALQGTKVNTTDIATIQSLPAYENGWSSAVVTNRNYPTLQETNGVMKVMSYQTAYLMQKGVPEWNSETTYYLGDICKGVGAGVLYKSKVNDNLNNPVTDTIYWEEYAGSATADIPATNYMGNLDGTPSYDGLTISMPAVTYNIPNGRSGDNTLDTITENVTASTYTISGNDGKYTLFYNNSTSNLHLAPNYTVRAAAFPIVANFNDVCYLTDNKMYVNETIAPNYGISSGVSVTSAGVVSDLGTLSFDVTNALPASPVFNLKFTTGADINTSQDLFTSPYAVGSISEGNLNIDIYSYAYSVNYYPSVYSGTYTFDSQTTTYSYRLGGETYYSSSAIALNSSLYTDENLTELFGTVSGLSDNTITVENSGSTVYSGSYEDTSSSVYTYTLGLKYIYSSAPLASGLTVFNDNTLNNPYGIIESVTSSNVVIHAISTSVGYVSSSGSGLVPSGNNIYSDVNLQTPVETSTGRNATYSRNVLKSTAGTIIYALAASTTYEGNLTFSGESYILTLNNVSSSLLTSRVPYIETNPQIYIGGSSDFGGTFDLTGTNITDVWTWNGYNVSTLDWQAEPFCKIGTVSIENGAISNLKIDYPIELFKVSDIETITNNISPIGAPQFTLDFDTLPENCIWLEGAKVLKSTYTMLVPIYGDKYAPSTATDTDTYLYLPDFRNRALWGAATAGYLSAGLPNITGSFCQTKMEVQGGVSGAFYYGGSVGANTQYANGGGRNISFNASRSSAIYGNSSTVQPPALKMRVYTRYQ